jgi:pantoate--beta-alanine ligase
MKVVTQVEELRNLLQNYDGKCGFVPTMGALHEGHLSLVKWAKKEHDIVVVSVFVNPTQFNEKSDLEKYPKSLKEDADLLRKEGVKILFAPSVEEVYPQGLSTLVDIDLDGLDELMEGEFRPGHFVGVMQVVKRLLDIVEPEHLYMGQKDFQQFTIIDKMIRELKLRVKLIVVPIKREAHGLAMSSRNERLSPETRSKAGVIYQVLKSIKKRKNQRTFEQLIEYAQKKLNKEPFKLEYIMFADGKTLQPVNSIDESPYIVCCLAVWADGIRLIDNIILKNKS